MEELGFDYYTISLVAENCILAHCVDSMSSMGDGVGEGECFVVEMVRTQLAYLLEQTRRLSSVESMISIYKITRIVETTIQGPLQ
jgi:hypothetical protein